MVSCLALEMAHTPIAYNVLSQQAAQYLELALRCFETGRRGIVAVGGLAGTGKSTLSSILAQRLQAVHLRSDAVRKPLFGIPLTERAPKEAYNEEMNRKTYRGLLERVHYTLESNRLVIVDAAFLRPSGAHSLRSSATILTYRLRASGCKVSPKIAKERVRLRVGDISDADESIVSLQETYPLGEIEWHHLDTVQHEVDAAARAVDWVSL